MKNQLKHLGCVFICGLVVFWSMGALVVAQAIRTGSIAGTVTDQTGGVVPGVEVTITNTATGQTRVVLSNESGAYAATALPAGEYEIAAELPGFKRKVLEGIILEAEQRLGVDILLEIGEVTQTVTVTEATPLVEKETGEVSSLVSEVQISEMPINGRNWSQYGALGTGVVATNTDARGIGQEGNPLLAVHGARTDKVRYAIDGIQNMDTGGQRGINNFPPPEGIQEIKFLKSNFRAASGSYGAGVGNVVTKAGGQEFHGTVYEFLRNNAMDSANFFATEAAPLKLNHFGFTIGGPFYIPGKYNTDKTKDFFFYSQSIYRRRGPSMVGATLLARTPTEAMRRGDFTGQKTIKDPLTGDPFPGNFIPEDRIDPNARILLDQLYPLPNRVGGQNFIAQPSQPTNWHQEMIRWDHHFTENANLMVRYIQDDWEQRHAKALWSAMSFPTIGSSYAKPGKNLVANLVNVFSPTLLNEFTFGFSWNTIHRPLIGGEERPSGLNIPEVFAENPGNKIPDIRLSQGWGSLSASNVPYDNGNPMLTFRDDFSRQVGNHSFKFGTEIIRMRKWVDASGRPQGDFRFTGAATGHAVADFLLGNAFKYLEQEGGNLSRNWINYQYDFYAQDDWKITPDFTFNYGLRYTIFQGGKDGRETEGRFAIWLPQLYDPAKAVTVLSNGRIVPDSGDLLNGIVTAIEEPEAFGGRDLYRTRLNHFAPRIGFAYSPWDKTVFRGGAGIYYGPGHIGRPGRLANNPPFKQEVELFNVLLTDPGGGGTRLLPGNVGGQDPDGFGATSYQWSLGIQREILPATALEFAYVGNRGLHLYYTRNLNKPEPDPNRTGSINAHRPFPGFANIFMWEPSSSSTYHALEVHLNRRFHDGLMTEVSYTFSRATGVADNFGDQPQDNRNLAAEWGLLDYDRTHVLVTNFVYELPFWRAGAQDTLAKKVLGGWQLGGILSFQSGMIGTVSLSGDNAKVGGGPQRPDRVGDPNNGPESLGQWFNTAAFAQPAKGGFGNAGRGLVRLPGLNNWDLAFYKNTEIGWFGGENARLQIRGELFNAFNHPQWKGVALNFNSGIFGQITSAHDPRIVQLALKVMF